MKVVFITKDYFKCDAPADAKCHMGKAGKGSCPRTRPAAHTDQLWLPYVEQRQPGGCNLENTPSITVKSEDMGKFWSLSWS